MSDAHLRSELREQNSLYERAPSVTPTFDQERCLDAAVAKRDLEKSEHQRRIEAIARKEKHIVQPSRVWLRAQIQQYLQTSVPRAQPVMRPEMSGVYASDRSAFLKRQARVDANARSLDGLYGARDALIEKRGRTKTLREELAALQPSNGPGALRDVADRGAKIHRGVREDSDNALSIEGGAERSKHRDLHSPTKDKARGRTKDRHRDN